eukprot:CAMPEP_0184482150 /NCGR_PEP_ID=MMETSP0113_2-20130426/3733_1 /TAXON_ID=91329 /ORGANISM="Norrisiella sphaerica, Strain BC52" /LENGTH=63 /DNA_ID=CAMNT_0026861729 /DNA_START=1275 /DNA_END=1466 /DNA_ORIENTATION=-
MTAVDGEGLMVADERTTRLLVVDLTLSSANLNPDIDPSLCSFMCKADASDSEVITLDGARISL